MKRLHKFMAVIVVAALLVGLSACGSSQGSAPESTQASTQADSQESAPADDQADAPEDSQTDTPEDSQADTLEDNQDDSQADVPQDSTTSQPVDIDLTELNMTMMIAEITNMVSSPDKYVGKRVKAVGTLNVIDYNNRHIFSCGVTDPTGCCGQLLEFEPQESVTYPDDFPSTGSVIFVEGTFATYEEDGSRYCRLENATFSTNKG
ncbi:MAG: hypothetical protein J6N77_05225 [Lachnospiraceae bacterium]|nr:hypothetical protein [Lachnospiraceae bacterium]